MLKIDKEKCQGCGVCEAMCPDVFKIGDDGKAQIINQNFEACGCDIQNVIDSCPEDAISLT